MGDALKKAAAQMEVVENDDEAERAARRKSRIDTGILPKAPTISAEVTSSWLRIFSEGKLGKKDVWNIPVTDMLAKEGQSETVDFRDASLTIDASAHVYSKRVEEVLTKTTSLAGGLASEDLESFAHLPEDEAAKLDDEEEGDAVAKEEVKAKRKRAANRSVNTLEMNEASLTMKRNEREYAVDPLFHKRSAIFDSGGAKGLLLNVLSSHNGFELVFDASDMVDDSVSPVSHAAHSEVEAEVRKLLATMLPANWQEAEICPEYAERKKGSSVALQQLLANEPEAMDIDNPHDFASDAYETGGPSSASMTSASMAVDGTNMAIGSAAIGGATMGGAGGAGDDDSDEDLAVHFGAPPVSGAHDASASDYKPPAWADYGGYMDHGDDDRDRDDGGVNLGGSSLLDSRLHHIEQLEQETDAIVQPDLDFYEVADGPNSEYTYFNRDKLANWSGPEHWKHKSLKTQTGAKGKASATHDDEEYQDEDGNIIKAAKSRGPRKQFRIDFMAPAPQNLEELLTSAGAGTVLPKTTLDKQLKDARMLMIPPDINYDVANFSATFLPHHVTKGARRRAEGGMGGVEAFGGGGGGSGNDFVDRGGDDDYEDNYNNDYAGAYAPVPQASDFMTEAMPQVLRPGDDGYLPNVAKIDKRVDVKALKQTIWKELCATTVGDSARDGVQIPVAMTTEKPFQDILEQLPHSMSEDVVREVSVPYCFVCLLHLANEKHLSIRQENMDALFITQTAAPART
jgi:condensin complex subunit 2